MIQLKPRDINDMLIAVTDTATLLYTLVDTASASAGSQVYYGNEVTNGVGVSNCVSIRPQDGDIRVVIAATPTAAKGVLVRSGTRMFFNGEVSKMKLIRVSGAATVAVDLAMWLIERGESSSANTDTITAVVDSEFPAASVLADGTANPTTTTTGANLMVFNGTTWDRARSGASAATVTLTGLQNTLPEAIYRTTSLVKTDLQVSPLESDSSGMLKNAEGYVDQFIDNTNAVAWVQMMPLAVATNALTYDISAALEASTISKATAGRFYFAYGRIDKTAPSGDYWIQILNSATLPADGAVTFLGRFKKTHVNGVDTSIDIDLKDYGVYGSAGLVVVLSTAEFTKVIAGAYLSLVVGYY